MIAFNDAPAAEPMPVATSTVVAVATATTATIPASSPEPLPAVTQAVPQPDQPPVPVVPPSVAPAPTLLTVAPTATQGIVQVTTPPQTGTMAAAAALQDIYHSRNPKWQVSLKSAKKRYKINVETIDLGMTSTRNGFAYLNCRSEMTERTSFLPALLSICFNRRVAATNRLNLPRYSAWLAGRSNCAARSVPANAPWGRSRRAWR